MENFAVDLDKVLDDFELNEDEQESASHYDKLQLEFRRENIRASIGSNVQLPVGLGAVGGWSEAVHDLPTEVRGPPDGQHDDEAIVTVCSRPLVSISESSISSNLPSCSSQECLPQISSITKDEISHDEDSTHLGLPTQKPDVTSDVNSHCEKLWPNLSNQSNLLKDLSSIDIDISESSSNAPALKDLESIVGLSNPSAANFEDKGTCSLPLNQSLLSCPLDVIPTDVPSSAGSLVSHESQHPDILDMRQNSQDENTSNNFSNYAELPAVRESNENLERNLSSLPESEQLHSDSPDIQREAFLLPDLMPTNSIDRCGMSLDRPHLPEVSNPAVVTENSLSDLSLNINEPAIVQESQSNNRIPEVVNVHQSAEQSGGPSGGWFEDPVSNIVDSIVVSEPLYSDHRSNSYINVCDNRSFDESSSEFHLPDRVSPTRLLPDVSASCKNSNVPAHLELLSDCQKEDRMGTPVVRFNPCSNVDEEELDAELQELEEEQARLQGAYSNSGFQAQEGRRSTSPEPMEVSNSSQSPDLIGGIGAVLELPSNEEEEGRSSPKELSCELRMQSSNVEQPEDDLCKRDPAIDPDLGEGHIGEREHDSVLDKQPGDDLPSSNLGTDPSPSDVVVSQSECELPRKTEGTEEVLSESTATDSLSLTSTLTDGESLSPEHQAISARDRPHTPPSLPDSPSRETPGTLVTAVYEDNGSKEGPSEGPVGDGERGLSGVGAVAPFWIPDVEAPNCQECGIKFTILKRRHHCRGCGRVLCDPCCHFKAPLPYMDFKEARVCATCLHLLTEVSEREEEQVGTRQSSRSPNPNNPMEYCSRIPPQQQVGAVGNGPPPTVMVPVGVLKRETSNSGNGSSSRPRGNKQVIFSDGIRPGGDLTELGGQTRPSSPFRKTGRNTRRVPQNMPGNASGGGVSGGARGMGSKVGLTPLRSIAPDTCLIPSGGGLPPVLLKASTNGEYVFDSNPDTMKLEEQMKGDGDPVVFALQKNLTVLVKQIKLDCCVGLEVWNVATRGLCNVGQEELVVLLEVNPGEKSPPPHLFSFLHTVYQQANKGNHVTELGHTIFTEPEGFLGSKDHGGFLYIRPTYQCLHKLVLPPAPYVFAVLIQKWETPWAKVFPLRLMLRLGAEFRYYPCPLVSTRNRKPVYCEIGHTIMNLLVDFRNYAYTIPVIQGFVIHMEDKKTTLLIPRNRYEQVWKALNNSNDHVLALGANFSPQSDSHLVTVEDDDGHYTTQAINIHNKPRKVTGASFIVFNGALKSNSGLKAKSSIVEDGLMVQIAGEMMTNLRESLRNMKDFDIPCGPTTSQPDELVLIRWVQDDKNFNVGIKSPIDGRQMDGVPSVKIHSGTDYVSSDHLIRWTEVFIIQGETTTGNNDVNISRLAESLARACCVALTPHLALLYDTGPNRLGLRATIHQDNVGYEAGMGGTRLLPLCMNELDTELIPVIHRAAANITDQAIILELLFHIMEQ